MKKYLFLINPEAGRKEPLIQTIYDQMKGLKLLWDLKICVQPEQMKEFINQGIEEHVDVIVIYGGDGTILNAVQHLLKTDIVLGIFPGGSANILSKTLGIPQNLKKACQLLISETAETRDVDLGRFGDKYFLTRLCLGLEADIVQATERHLQKKLGIFAYGISSVKALKTLKVSEYHLVIDGKKHQTKGIACFIANTSNLGLWSMNMSSLSSITDSKLDVIIIPEITRFLHLKLWFRKIFKPKGKGLFQHWFAQKVIVQSNPKQVLHCDGEICDEHSIEAEIADEKIKILVNPKKFKQ